MSTSTPTSSTSSTSDAPKQDPASSEVSSTAVLPEAPYSQEDIEDLAASLSRSGPYFFGSDVRSYESSMTVAKQLSDRLLEMGYDLPSLTGKAKKELDEVRKPEATTQTSSTSSTSKSKSSS